MVIADISLISLILPVWVEMGGNGRATIRLLQTTSWTVFVVRSALGLDSVPRIKVATAGVVDDVVVVAAAAIAGNILALLLILLLSYFFKHWCMPPTWRAVAYPLPRRAAGPRHLLQRLAAPQAG